MRARASVSASGCMSSRRARETDSMVRLALWNCSELMMASSCLSESSWSLHRSKTEMDGLTRSSRRASVRGGRGGSGVRDWGLGLGVRPPPPTSSAPPLEARGRRGQDPSACCAGTSPRGAGRDKSPPPPQARGKRVGAELVSSGNAVLKSYSANWFAVFMRELSHVYSSAQARCGVVHGCCAQSVKCGGSLRTKRAMRGGGEVR